MEEGHGRDVVVTRSHHCVLFQDLVVSEVWTFVQNGPVYSHPHHVSRRSPYTPRPLGGDGNDEDVDVDGGEERGGTTSDVPPSPVRSTGRRR